MSLKGNRKGLRFGEVIWKWGFIPRIHLGDDIVVTAGTEVRAIGEGEVVFSKTLPGSESKRSWGGVVVLRHNKKQVFYSIYGHLNNLAVKPGDRVEAGQRLGEVAARLTPENGWWKQAHLHRAIYIGPWRNEVLPGYWRLEKFWRTRLAWWQEPREFIKRFRLDREV